MKKRFIKSMSFIFCLVLLAGLSGTTASKAKSKNTIKVTLTVGKTYQLKVTGTKKKIKWNTSNKKIATVSSKGKIKAKKAGKVKIYAKIGKKKLICYLTVKSKKTKKSKNSKANTSTTKKPANTNTTVQPSVTQTPANTVAPIAPVSPTGVPGVTEKPSATVQPDATPISTPQYTDGPKLEQTYHANLRFATDDWTNNYANIEKGYIGNSSNGFFCYDSLGNYITDDKYKVDYEEVTIDHAGMYDFKISGLNNMLQNAKDFLILFLDTDMGLNTNMQCRDLELYMDGQLVKTLDRVNIAADTKSYFYVKSVWSALSTINEKILVPKDSIEIKCFIDPGQPSGIDQDDVINNYTILKDYIGNYNHNDFSSEEYSDYAFTGKGMILEDNKYLYMISYDGDDDFINWEFSQYDKKSQEVKTQYDVLGTRLAGYVYYNVSDDEYVSACIGNLDTTSLSRFQFKDNRDDNAGSALNTEANQEFQRSLKGWNQLLNERLHMSLKDFGFVSYE